MQDRPHRRGVRSATLLTVALVAACDAPEPGNATIAAPVAEAPPPPTPTLRPPASAADRVERGVAAPPPSPAEPPRDFSTEGVTRNFTDPPLPPELLDDGGLKPLPTSRP